MDWRGKVPIVSASILRVGDDVNGERESTGGGLLYLMYISIPMLWLVPRLKNSYENHWAY